MTDMGRVSMCVFLGIFASSLSNSLPTSIPNFENSFCDSFIEEDSTFIFPTNARPSIIKSDVFKVYPPFLNLIGRLENIK